MVQRLGVNRSFRSTYLNCVLFIQQPKAQFPFNRSTKKTNLSNKATPLMLLWLYRTVCSKGPVVSVKVAL